MLIERVVVAAACEIELKFECEWDGRGREVNS